MNSLQIFVSELSERLRDETANPAVEARNLLRIALKSDSFILDCVVEALGQFLNRRLNSISHTIFDSDDSCLSLRLTCWAPVSENVPHQHKSWSVTGVLWNRLTFQTYVLRDNMLVPEKRIEAMAREAGWVPPGSIHNVVNEENAPAISIHISSGVKSISRSNLIVRGETVWYSPLNGAKRPNELTSTLLVRSYLELVNSLNDSRTLRIRSDLIRLASC
jgi:predicted metal-dependent enzyme (double-stranded beta helix superfamily)